MLLLLLIWSVMVAMVTIVHVATVVVAVVVAMVTVVMVIDVAADVIFVNVAMAVAVAVFFSLVCGLPFCKIHFLHNVDIYIVCGNYVKQTN